jgi:membrane protein DedA with SNARE-associated domain
MENTLQNKKMKWYHYIMVFLSALFLANFVPHFVNGISGIPFPSPFSDPPGKGLSSPLLNVIWAFINLIPGYFLLRYSKMNSKNYLALIIFFIGIVIMSVNLSLTFTDKMK